MRVRLVPVLTLQSTLALALSMGAACRQAPAGGALLAAGARPASSASISAAEINGVVISTADVDSAIGQALSKLKEQIYSTRLTRLDGMIDDRLIADDSTKRGLSVADFLDAEVNAKVPQATDADTAAFLEANKARLPGDLAKWQHQIRGYINEQRAATARTALVKPLREAAHVKVYLSPPPIFRANVVLTGAQLRGSATAPVTIGVLGLPLPVLPAGPAGAGAAAAEVRRSPTAGLQRHADRRPAPAGPRRRRGRSVHCGSGTLL